jgi:hypothetical protein
LRGAKFLERSGAGSHSIELCDDIVIVEEGLVAGAIAKAPESSGLLFWLRLRASEMRYVCVISPPCFLESDPGEGRATDRRRVDRALQFILRMDEVTHQPILRTDEIYARGRRKCSLSATPRKKRIACCDVFVTLPPFAVKQFAFCVP